MVAFLILGFAPFLQAQTDFSAAPGYFVEMSDICHRDDGALWGVSLCGPVLFVDRQTRQLAANQFDSEGFLTRVGGVFVGTLPKNVNVANTAVQWAGKNWTMMVWPPPDTPLRRRTLFMHESFHRVQDSLGLSAATADNSHLDTAEGRFWLKMEWRALARALESDPAERENAIRDALLFRSHRRQSFPGAAATENALEIHEGLAEYTGIRLATKADESAAAYAHGQLLRVEPSKTFVRSFAYRSGPAYGLLLDDYLPEWRNLVTKDADLGRLVGDVLELEAANPRARASDYGGHQLWAEENERSREHQQLLAEYRGRLVDGPVLVLLTVNMNFRFNPNELVPLGELGTVYPTMPVTDAWGILEVSKGALLRDFKRIAVPAPGDIGARPLAGDGWKLDLEEGWSVRKGERPGDYVVFREAGH